MTKELKIELFNIYDIVVFEDENGITQDCVCVITNWEKEADEVVGVIQCNNHSISIYQNGSYKVWEKDGKDLPYYATNKKIIHLYTLKKDNRFYEVYPTNDYEAIENAKPNEALKCLEKLDDMFYLNKYRTTEGGNKEEYEFYPHHTKEYDIIEQTLIKEQKMEEENSRYKQLEEEIGCPLDVVFKLVNQNELYYQFYNELQHWTSVKVDLRKKVIWYCKQTGGHYACSQPLSNYGKTFWLREDKSE